MPHRLGLAALIAFGLATTASAADPLPRGPVMGFANTPVADGLRVDRVAPGEMAARLGLQPGDMIVALNGGRIESQQAFFATFAALPLGKPIRLTVVRAGKRLTFSAVQTSRQPETYANGVVHYGEVDNGPERLRDILASPSAVAEPPVVYYVSGYTCGSIDGPGPGGLFGKLAQSFLDAGIAFYRVEKPGVGDSRGGTPCTEGRLADEIAAFRAAYLHLIALRFPADRIFILGHSLGGVEAPLIVAGLAPPRGIVPYGTMLRNWGDYMRDINAFQGFAIAGDDPVEAYKQGERDRTILDAFFFGHQTPQQIVAANPAAADRFKDVLAWDGGDHAYGRSWTVLQDLTALDLPEAWANVPTNVLSLYGATDEIALTSEDQRRIADIVNYYRPGTARFVELPDTMHLMNLVGDRESFREKNVAAGGNAIPGAFNPEVPRQIVAWIRESMAKPPVRTLTFPDSLAERVKAMKAAAAKN